MVAAIRDISSADIANFCRRRGIKKLSIFGSALRDDFKPESDIDVLVEFEPNHTPDFFTLDELSNELSSLFHGRHIDLVTERSISPLIRDQVLAQARVQYEG